MHEHSRYMPAIKRVRSCIKPKRMEGTILPVSPKLNLRISITSNLRIIG